MKRIAALVLLVLSLVGLFGNASRFAHAGQMAADGSETEYCKYLVIVPDDESWVSALKPFVEWKTREGLYCEDGLPASCVPIKLTNLTGIASIYGSSNASSIRRYIIDFWKANNYSASVNTLKYVLLVGDVKYVPSYLYNVTIGSYYCTYASDQYYADFYYPAQDKYINPAVDKTDWKAEVYVGRFPVNNAEELRNVVDKTVTYEMYADALQQSPAGWQRRMLFLGAIMDNGYSDGSGLIWKDGAYVAELIKQNCSSWWMGTTGPVPSPTVLYDTNNNASLWQSGYGYMNNLHNLTTASIINQLSNVGFSSVLSVSHGNLDSLQGRTSGSPGNWNTPFFMAENVSALRNNYTLPFWFVDACHAGSFEADLWRAGERCLGEELLLADPSSCGGVVGFIGCSNLSWYRFYYGATPNRPEVLETLSDRLANLAFCQLYSVSSPVDYAPWKWGLGAALFEAKRLYNATSWISSAPNSMHMATLLGFNLLGDPSLQIWSEKPADTSNWYSISVPETVKTGENFVVSVNFTASVSGGSYPPMGPREGAKICVSRIGGGGESSWCAVNLTDASGEAVFTAPADPGVYNVTVVDHPYLVPYLAQIQVLQPAHDVAVTNVTASESSIEQRLSLVINVTVENQGDYTEDFNVTVYANETEIAVRNLTLTAANSTTVTLSWNTTDVPLGSYAIRAEADQVSGETDVSDNAFTVGYSIALIPEYADARIIMLAMFFSAVASLVLRKQRAILRNPSSGRAG